jgi:hypothetical protein
MDQEAVPTPSAAPEQGSSPIAKLDSVSDSQRATGKGHPMRPRLRLFTGEDDDSCSSEPAQVNVRFGEITRALVEAVRWDRTWLRDFENDEVRVSSDLYEVIASFTRLRPSA